MASDRSRRRNLTLSAGAFIVLLGLYITGGVTSGLKSLANAVTTPFSWSVAEIARPIGHVFAGAVNYSDVVAQNQKLRYELGQAQLKANEAWALDRQLQEISTQLNVPYVGSLPLIAAQVSSLSPTNFAANVAISKGRDEGVLAGMPVVANGGLVGTVISTTAHTAVVRLISDVNSSIGVTYSSTSSSIVVSGRGLNNGLVSTEIPLTTTVSPGTILTTDGLNGGLYPPGLPVARVAKVTLTPGAASYDLTLQPIADLRNLMYVDVVQWEPST